jgi:hypothetical protein
MEASEARLIDSTEKSAANVQAPGCVAAGSQIG